MYTLNACTPMCDQLPYEERRYERAPYDEERRYEVMEPGPSCLVPFKGYCYKFLILIVIMIILKIIF